MLAAAERLRPGTAPVTVTLAFTALRIREAPGLRWRDVDLDADVIRLRFQGSAVTTAATRS